MDIEKVLDDYRNGDEGKRLCLFLAFRDLRDYFSLIEQENPDEGFAILDFPWNSRRHVARAA
jgi:hypothetical protein